MILGLFFNAIDLKAAISGKNCLENDNDHLIIQVFVKFGAAIFPRKWK